MCVSAFGVSAFAANYDEYKDADTVKTDYAANETAIDVVTGLKIINGDGGYLKLGNGLTRAEAAKILAVVDLGTKTADSVKSSTINTGYSDTQGHWASGYIAYCTNKKYLAGTGDGTFEPDGQLTGYAFGKMMLNVLGYGFDEVTVQGTTTITNKYTGSLWEINVLADGSDINLFDKVSSNLSGAITRADAMQITYNALLQAKNLRENNKKTDYYDVAGELDIAISTTNDPANECRPTVTVSNTKGEKLTSYAAQPDYTFTAKKGGKDETSINDELGKKGPDALKYAAKITDSNGTATYGGAKSYRNGRNNVFAADGMEEGDEVEIYLVPGSKTDIDTIITTHYGLYQVEEIKPLSVREINANAMSEDPGVKNATSTIKISLGSDNVTVFDTKFADFNYEKGDYILAAVKSTTSADIKEKAILHSMAAETVSGKITAIKGVEVAVDGTYYKVATGFTTPTLEAEGTWALDKAGKIGAEIEVIEVSSDYALIYNVTADPIRNEDGKTSFAYTVYVVKPDGTKAAYPVENKPGSNNLANLRINTTNEAVPTVPTYVTAYSLNADGEIVKASASEKIGWSEDTISKADASVSYTLSTPDTGTGTAYATSSTQFIFVPTANGPDQYKPTVVTGYKNVNINTDSTATTKTNVKVVVDRDNNILYAFVLSSNGSETSGAKYAVVLDATPVESKQGPDTVYTYKVAIDGVEDTITTGAKISSVAAGDILSYTVTDGKASESVVTALSEGTKIEAANADYVVIGSTQYSVTDKTEFYKVTKYEEAPGKVAYEVEAISGVTTRDALKYYAANDATKELNVVFILNDETPATSTTPAP